MGQKALAYAFTRTQARDDFRRRDVSYLPESPFAKAIIDACRLQRGSGPIRILDAMCGPGKLGELISNSARESKISVDIWYNEIRWEALRNATSRKDRKIGCDVRRVGQEFTEMFDLVVVRYGIKDITMGQQRNAILSLMKSLKNGGRMVLADLYSLEELQAPVTRAHVIKQELSGREKGRCHIPTIREWMELIRTSGFQEVEVEYIGEYRIGTQDWAGHFGENADSKVYRANNQFEELCTTFQNFKIRCDVIFENGNTIFSSQHVVISATKRTCEEEEDS